MPRLTRDSKISVGNKELQIDDILKTIIFLPARQVKTFFNEIGLKVPRELRMFVLREVLRERVIETRKSRLTLADELNYRLSWFTEYSETQLENLLIFYEDSRLEKDYLEEFWTDLLSYMVEKQVPPKDMKKLVDLSITHVKAVGLELPNMKTYNRELKDMFFDSFGRIDGLAPAKFRPVLFKSSTLTEVRDLGSKYGVDVPRRLKKSELADIIIKEVKERGDYTEELENEIRGMSVLVMQRYAIDHDIKASTELKKEEIIEYILANANETKEIYFTPSSEKDYDKEIHEINDIVEPAPIVVAPVIEQPKEEVIEEKVIEEVVEEPIQEPIEEQVEEVEDVIEEAEVDEPIEEVKTVVEEKIIEKVQYVESSVDLTALVDEVKKLREAVEKLSEKNAKEDIEEEKVEVIETSDAGVVIEQVTSDAIVINSAEFVGDPKHLKKVLKKDEIEERERFIEQKKAEEKASLENEPIEKRLPGELRFFGKMFKYIGRGILKVLKVLLKFALVIAVIGLLLFAIYGTITYFVELDFLVSFNQTLNNIQVAGKGILQHFHDLLASLGL